MSQFDRHAPQNLGKLFGNMVDYMKKDGATRIRLKPAQAAGENPSAFCPICLVVHSRETIIAGDTQMKSKNCEECQAQIDQGGIAIRCKTDGRHSFVWSEGLVGQGPIIEVDKAEYDAIEAYVKSQQPPSDAQT